jgi:2-polyprenyl-3-methyl-5-hydroxy-6-metoxy-1,4-benzoquinol methylase
MTTPIDEITNSYYATTAASSHRPTAAHYDHAAGGLLRRLGEWLPKDRSAVCLDLACGCGELVYALEREGFTRTSGVDLCAEELDEARRFVRGTLAHADVLEHLASLREGSVGFVTAFNIVEHLPKERIPAFFREARRALSPGGSLVAMVPNAMSPFGASTRYWDITHQIAFTPSSVRQLARAAGFADDEIAFRECGPMPHGVKSAVRYLAWQGLRGAIAAWFLIENGGTRGGVYTMDMLFRLQKKG